MRPSVRTFSSNVASDEIDGIMMTTGVTYQVIRVVQIKTPKVIAVSAHVVEDHKATAMFRASVSDGRGDLAPTAAL